MRGRKPKPTHIKLLTGNPGQRKINRREPVPRAGVPTPPSFLGRAAKQEWRRCLQDSPPGLVSRLDRHVLALYCMNAARIAELQQVLEEQGMTVVTGTGYPMPRPEMGIQTKLQTIQARLCAELGFSPSSRSRVTMAEPPAKDPDEELLFGGRPARGKRTRAG